MFTVRGTYKHDKQTWYHDKLKSSQKHEKCIIDSVTLIVDFSTDYTCLHTFNVVLYTIPLGLTGPHELYCCHQLDTISGYHTQGHMIKT